MITYKEGVAVNRQKDTKSSTFIYSRFFSCIGQLEITRRVNKTEIIMWNIILSPPNAGPF